MNPNKKVLLAPLMAASIVIGPAFSTRVFAEDSRSIAPQWSVQVDKIDAGDVNIETELQSRNWWVQLFHRPLCALANNFVLIEG
jgi:hypothetical protein